MSFSSFRLSLKRARKIPSVIFKSNPLGQSALPGYTSTSFAVKSVSTALDDARHLQISGTQTDTQPHLRPTRASGAKLRALLTVPPLSCKNARVNLSSHVRKPEIPARVTIRQFFMIQTHQMQDRRVEIMDGHGIFHRVHPQLIG